MLKVIYTFFTGLLLATFVGVGIAALYPAPQYPEYPVALEGVDVCLIETTAGNRPCPKAEGMAEPTDEQKQIKRDYDAAVKQHQEDQQRYARNVSITSFACALLFAAIGLLLESRLKLIADGVLLGGLFTLVYGIGWGFATEDNVYRFMVVTIGLVVVLILGYLKFVGPESKR
ncbi:hypothetical protein HY375_02515 [Candidatus Berkelbacteria bacterium]|nr:hypothetical protein [Candidatus Berkelbacteria bacterium]